MYKYPAHLEIPKNKKFFQHKKNYKGYPMKQADSAVFIFRSFFERQRFDKIIELGTGSGGFTVFLGENYENKVHTFDITDKLSKVKGIKGRLNELNVNIYLENIFETNTVANLIKENGRVLLLCDNGNKPEEVRLFSPYLKTNDVIMVHDYLKDADIYYDQNIWRCCAFIDDYVDYDKTLTPYYQEEFSNAYWMCRVKGV